MAILRLPTMPITVDMQGYEDSIECLTDYNFQCDCIECGKENIWLNFKEECRDCSDTKTKESQEN